MASILEMTVDYLKIVNSNLPHEFHAHVLDVMTKGGNSPPVRPARAHVACGRGPRGGRGRGARRSTTTSPPARPVSLQDCGSQAQIVTRALSRGMISSPVSIISRVAGNGNSRGSKMSRRSGQQSVVVSPSSQGVPGPLYLLESKDRGPVRQETIITNTMTLPTYLPSSHYAVSHGLFNDTSPSSSTPLAAAATHTYPPPPSLSTMAASSSSSSSSSGSSMDCGLPVPRLYASAHLSVEPSFLSHGHIGNPPPLTTPMGARYSLGGPERGDGGVAGSFGDSVVGGVPPPPPPPPPAYFHYFSNMPDLSPAYTMAGGGGGGGGGCGGVGVPLCGEFMAASSGSLHPLTSSSSSAFTPSSARLQLAPSRGKGDVTLQSGGLENSGDSVVYTMMDAACKTSK